MATCQVYLHFIQSFRYLKLLQLFTNSKTVTIMKWIEQKMQFSVL